MIHRSVAAARRQRPHRRDFASRTG